MAVHERGASTVKELSLLPGRRFPDAYPRYVSRQRFVEYLDACTRHHGIAPRLGEQAVAITLSRLPTAWVDTVALRCAARRSGT